MTKRASSAAGIRLRRNINKPTAATTANASCGRTDALRANVWGAVTVIVTTAVEDPGTTAGGEKLTVAPAGKPAALKVTAPVKGDPCELTASVKFAGDPAIEVCCVPPVTPTLKSGSEFTASSRFAEVLA
jgi:hypothetical protein